MRAVAQINACELLDLAWQVQSLEPRGHSYQLALALIRIAADGVKDQIKDGRMAQGEAPYAADDALREARGRLERTVGIRGAGFMTEMD